MESSCLEKKKHILIVDDEPTLLMSYRLILEMQGYESSSALNAVEAKTILASDKIDLLICDLTLGPGQSGTAVIEYARSISPEMPCALATGYNTQELEEWARQYGATLLQKPIPIHRFLQTIAQLLTSSRRRKTA
jgi:DNA-binding NtrC family response regulator